MSADRGGSSGRAERRQSVRVSILGDEYAIRTDASEAHTREVAEHVDRVIRQVLSSGMVVETHKAAILAALQITDELFRARADAQQVSGAIQELSAEVKRWLPPAKRADG